MLREGERDAGVCMHKRKLALATKIIGLCGCKRRIEIIYTSLSKANSDI